MTIHLLLLVMHGWMNSIDRYPKEIGVPFECLLIWPMLRPKMMKRLKDAGLVRVQTGIESGSIKESKKNSTTVHSGNRAIMNFAEYNKELGLNIVYDVIIDNPHATEEMKLETAEFLLDLPTPMTSIFIRLTTFPERL